MELTGEFAEEAEIALDALHHGIDTGNHIVTETHDFELKLDSFEVLIAHIDMNYDQMEIVNFMHDIIDEIAELAADLRKFEKAEIYILHKEEAAQRHNSKWIFYHRKKIEDQIEHEEEVDREIIHLINTAFKNTKKLFRQAKHMFKIHEHEAEVVEVKLDLKEKDKEFRYIIKKLLQFFQTYERIFEKELKELERI